MISLVVDVHAAAARPKPALALPSVVALKFAASKSFEGQRAVGVRNSVMTSSCKASTLWFRH